MSLVTNRESAQYELAQIIADPKHPYNDDRAPWIEHEKAVALVNRLIAITRGFEVTLEGCYDEIFDRQENQRKETGGEGERSSAYGTRRNDNEGLEDLTRAKFKREGEQLKETGSISEEGEEKSISSNERQPGTFYNADGTWSKGDE